MFVFKGFRVKYLIIGLFMVVNLIGYSQNKKYIDGYVITVTGDTISGKIKKANKEVSCNKFKFIDSKGEKIKIKIKNSDVFAYKRGSDLFFKKSYERPVVIGKMEGYMKLIIDGNVKLFRFNYISGGMNGVSYYQDYYLEKEGAHILVYKMSFKNNMIDYFSDNEELINKIENKELKYSDLEEIVSVFNKSKK